jgi:3-isopropylmalate/(R)-2-methylmalate dehydratase small subunit
LLEADTEEISENDALQIDINKGIIRDTTNGIVLEIRPLPVFMQELLRAGGIVNYLKGRGELKV